MKKIKAYPDLKRIPVVILTTSKYEIDILQANDQHANNYITKPVELEGLIEVV